MPVSAGSGTSVASYDYRNCNQSHNPNQNFTVMSHNPNHNTNQLGNSNLGKTTMLVPLSATASVVLDVNNTNSTNFLAQAQHGQQQSSAYGSNLSRLMKDMGLILI
jgi:hypothetical protein